LHLQHSAILTWLPAEGRGTARRPHGLRYVGIARFDSDGPEWPEGAFSVVCEFDVPPSERDSDSSEARVRFVLPDAPGERLSPGTRFQLYEGSMSVAVVEVLW
jgi:hypothetical protein